MKDNKLLAEYLGLKSIKQENGEYCYLDDRGNICIWGDEWEPDKDWNQLMMVIEKIRHELDDTYIKECKIYDVLAYLTLMRMGGHGDHPSNPTIRDYCIACAEYIKSKGNKS